MKNQREKARSLGWIGSSLVDLKDFPAPVVREIGYALHQAQSGGKSSQAKPLHGFGGASVLEIVENFQTDAYRAVYTVRFEEAIYVLHCFQKKSTRGKATPKPDLDAITRNLKIAEEKHRQFLLPNGTQSQITHGSGNVFADLGLPDAEELQWKARLLDEIGRIIQSKGWTSLEAAKRAGIGQEETSYLLNGRITAFSVERLLVVLNLLGHSVEMRVSKNEVASGKARTIVKSVAKVA